MTIFVGALAAVNPDREALFIVLSIIAGFGVGGCIVPAATIGLSFLFELTVFPYIKGR